MLFDGTRFVHYTEGKLSNVYTNDAYSVSKFWTLCIDKEASRWLNPNSEVAAPGQTHFYQSRSIAVTPTPCSPTLTPHLSLGQWVICKKNVWLARRWQWPVGWLKIYIVYVDTLYSQPQMSGLQLSNSFMFWTSECDIRYLLIEIGMFQIHWFRVTWDRELCQTFGHDCWRSLSASVITLLETFPVYDPSCLSSLITTHILGIPVMW